MSVKSDTIYWVACDEPDCFLEGDDAYTQISAVHHAEDDGFVTVIEGSPGGRVTKHYCEDHAPNGGAL